MLSLALRCMMFDVLSPNAVYLRKQHPICTLSEYEEINDKKGVSPEELYKYRLLSIEDDGYVFIHVEHRMAFPQFVEFADIDQELADGEIERAEDPWVDVVSRNYAPGNKHLDKRDRNYESIKGIVSHPQYFKKHVRAAVVNALLGSEHRSKSTLYRYSRRYWQRGQTINALLPDVHKTRGKDKGLRKVPQNSAGPSGINMTPKIASMMHSAVMDTIMSGNYRVDRKGKLKNLFDINAAYCELLQRYCGGDTQLLDENCPSFAQFKKYYYEVFTPEERAQAKHGKRYFNANNRQLIGTVRKNNPYGEVRFIIDSTPFEVGAANEDRFPLGRPTLYTATDEYSRAFVGFWLTLTPPSYYNAVQCMTVAVSNKSEFLSSLGMADSTKRWPMEGVPKSFFADLGSEFKTKHIEQFVNVFHRTVTNSGAGQPEKRAVVEKGFDRIHREIRHKVPGVVSKYLAKKAGGKNSQDDYTLVLQELNKLIARAIMTLNNKPLAKWDADATFPTELAKTPNNIWQWRKGDLSGLLPKVDSDFFRFSMLKREEATVTNNLLKIDKVQFECPTFSGLRLTGNKKVKKVTVVRYMDDASAIFLVPKEGESEYVRCELSHYHERFEGVPWADVIATIKAEKEPLKLAMHEHHKQQVKDLMYAKELTTNAKRDRELKVGHLPKPERNSLLGNKQEMRCESAQAYGNSSKQPVTQPSSPISPETKGAYVSRAKLFMDDEE